MKQPRHWINKYYAYPQGHPRKSTLCDIIVAAQNDAMQAMADVLKDRYLPDLPNGLLYNGVYQDRKKWVANILNVKDGTQRRFIAETIPEAVRLALEKPWDLIEH
jgi:hypothetical protein